MKNLRILVFICKSYRTMKNKYSRVHLCLKTSFLFRPSPYLIHPIGICILRIIYAEVSCLFSVLFQNPLRYHSGSPVVSDPIGTRVGCVLTGVAVATFTFNDLLFLDIKQYTTTNVNNTAQVTKTRE